MFRSTASLKREAAEKRVRPLVAEYMNSRQNWYDGSVTSIEERVDKCSHVLSEVNEHLTSLPKLTQLSRDLSLERQRLLSYRNHRIDSLRQQETQQMRTSSHREAFNQLPEVAKRWVTLESQKFVKSNPGLSDTRELVIRSSNYVADNTTGLSAKQLKLLTAAFQDRLLTSG